MAYSHDDLLRLLGENEAALRRCRMQSEKINKCVAEELDRVNGALAQMVPGMVTRSPASAAKYQALIGERGRLSVLEAS